MNEDLQWWKAMQAGDKDAFLQLYRKYYHALYFVGLREIKDAALVKDTIQQLFLYLWEKKSGLGNAKDVKAYLMISFLRKLTADWKKRARYEHLELVWNSGMETPLPSPEEKLISKQSESSVHNLLMLHINSLPARQRELIILKFYEGLSYDEIVERTQLSYRTVYNKIHEALKKLRTDLQKDKNSCRDYSDVLPVIIAWLITEIK